MPCRPALVYPFLSCHQRFCHVTVGLSNLPSRWLLTWLMREGGEKLGGVGIRRRQIIRWHCADRIQLWRASGCVKMYCILAKTKGRPNWKSSALSKRSKKEEKQKKKKKKKTSKKKRNKRQEKKKEERKKEKKVAAFSTPAISLQATGSFLFTVIGTVFNFLFCVTELFG